MKITVITGSPHKNGTSARRDKQSGLFFVVESRVVCVESVNDSLYLSSHIIIVYRRYKHNAVAFNSKTKGRY